MACERLRARVAAADCVIAVTIIARCATHRQEDAAMTSICECEDWLSPLGERNELALRAALKQRLDLLVWPLTPGPLYLRPSSGGPQRAADVNIDWQV